MLLRESSNDLYGEGQYQSQIGPLRGLCHAKKTQCTDRNNQTSKWMIQLKQKHHTIGVLNICAMNAKVDCKSSTSSRSLSVWRILVTTKAVRDLAYALPHCLWFRCPQIDWAIVTRMGPNGLDLEALTLQQTASHSRKYGNHLSVEPTKPRKTLTLHSTES